MRVLIYNFLVNKQVGIKNRYHSFHDNSHGIKKALSWIYLFWLNFAYYCLFQHWLAKDKSKEIYERKNINTDYPESNLAIHKSLDNLDEALRKYDIISFDIFDTLIFRPFSAANDLFYIMGQKLEYMDFKRIRMEAESKARIEQYKKSGSYEIDLAEIWKMVEKMTGLNAVEGMQLEIETELSLCYANSYMKKVFDNLVSSGKHVVITSDMYLPKEILQQLLIQNGYGGYEELYVSCETGLSKAIGELYDYVKSECISKYGNDISFAHVGDNEISDIKHAKEHGFKAFHYPSVNNNTMLYRAFDMSPIIGAAYRGIINNRIYSGIDSMNMNQEFGFIYGGLFILGYCNYIHSYVEANDIDTVMFLSRDGEIIKKIYDGMFPEDNTCYAYISRLAAVKLTAEYMKYDFIRKMIFHKVGIKKTVNQVLDEMELSNLVLPKFDCYLTPENVDDFIEYINENWSRILEIYKEQRDAAGEWYKDLLGGTKSAVAVDIGWAGSGYLALKTLFTKEWKLDCQLTGIVAGTNTINNVEPDMSETMILDGSLSSYLYSSRDNRDLYKKHDPAKGYNLFFELITSSPSPSFKGFYYDENGNVELKFSKPESNPEGIKDIWDGIEKFVSDYRWHFSDYEYMFNISGRDAYAPMIVASSNDEKYLNKIYSDFSLNVGVE